jgi:drug/metabolite transporter (DMT)-like permease
MFSILLGVLSALSWGAADFTGGLASRKANAFQTVFVVEVIGFVLLPGAALLVGDALLTWQEWLWCAAAGGVGVFGLALLYQSFADGKMSIAAPVSAITAAAVPIVVGFISEGLVAATDLAGFILALIAVWLVSQMEDTGKKLHVRLADLRLPLLSGVCFGLYFVWIHQGSQGSVLWPMVATRSMGMLVMAVFLLARRQSLLPVRSVWPILLLNFALDICGNVFFILASQVGRMDVAAVLTSLYPGMTILLAWIFLKERIRPVQWVGIAAALGAIILITI